MISLTYWMALAGVLEERNSVTAHMPTAVVLARGRNHWGQYQVHPRRSMHKCALVYNLLEMEPIS